MKKSTFILFLLSLSLWSQPKLQGKFSPAEDFNFAFLYEATPTGANYVDRSQLDSLGKFQLTLPKNLTPGIYKVVYAIPPEENNFDFIYNGNEDISFEFDLDKGISFLESNENKLWSSYLKSMEMINQTISNYYSKGVKDEAAYNDIIKTLKETQSAYEESAKGMLVSTFITSNKPYIPESYEDVSTYSEKLKTQYFKSVDFDNNLLQSSTFISDRINNYVFGVSDEPTDAIYKEQIDGVQKAISNASNDTQLRINQMLYEEFIQLNNDPMAIYVGKTYLKPIAEKLNNQELISTIKAFENTAIGQIAPDFDLSVKDSSLSLSTLSGSEYYLLVFWSSGCSHCLKELPELHQYLIGNSRIKVIAYGLEDNATQWNNTIKKLPDFLHVYGPKKWDNPLVQKYNLSATPTYFLLDSNKKIIAKPYDISELEYEIKGL